MTVVKTSMLPWTALEYGQIPCATAPSTKPSLLRARRVEAAGGVARYHEGMTHTAAFRALGIALGMLLTSCTSAEKHPALEERGQTGVATIEHYGEMMPVMREGRTEARVALAKCAGPHAFAVGALAGLDGEITVIDGAAWVSRVRNGAFVTSGPEVVSTDQATLLIATRVSQWQTTRLDEASGGAELEAAIERVAAARGLDTSRPLPFMIEGEATSLDMHVINGFCPSSGDAAAAGREPWRPALAEPARVVIVGFLAKDSAGVMTHHGTSIHAHALLTVDGRRVTGHIDSMTIAAGAAIRVP